MIVSIILLGFTIFAATYPLCFWISCDDPLQNRFHRFHLGCPAIMAGLIVFGLWFLDIPDYTRNLSIIWAGMLFYHSFRTWNKERVDLVFVTASCLFGCMLYVRLYQQMVSQDILGMLISGLGGLILSCSFYTMNLGHWYLNVHGLSLVHLNRSCKIFTGLLAFRFIFDLLFLFVGKVKLQWSEVSYWTYSLSLNGFMIWIAILFGTIFPLFGMYFVFGTLKAKSTQSATGILFVLLSAVLLGYIAYQYYLIKIGITL